MLPHQCCTTHHKLKHHEYFKAAWPFMLSFFMSMNFNNVKNYFRANLHTAIVFDLKETNVL